MVCVLFRTHIAQENLTYILVRMFTTPMEESHVEENRTAQIWRSGPKNILVTAACKIHVTKHVRARDSPCERVHNHERS